MTDTCLRLSARVATGLCQKLMFCSASLSETPGGAKKNANMLVGGGPGLLLFVGGLETWLKVSEFFRIAQRKRERGTFSLLPHAESEGS